MKIIALAVNPFSLMMEPERVLQIMERSQELRGLRRHKLRPLDKPLIPFTKEALASAPPATRRKTWQSDAAMPPPSC